MKKTAFLRVLTVLLATGIFTTGCDQNNQPIDTSGTLITDAALWKMVQSTTTWSYYKHNDTFLERGSGSGHTQSHLRTRYNARAATQLDLGGKVLVDPVFPDSSLIVKELATGRKVEQIAVMFKMRGASNAGPGGWIWAEYTPTGEVVRSAIGGSSMCSDCHSSGIDYTRMNSAHP
jgi:hypothetical protein